jgi:hypothetical protein
LKPIDEVNLPESEDEVLDETNKAGLAKAATRRRNAVAMTNYEMAFTCKTTLGMIFKASSTNWPTGKASKVTDLLLRKFTPQDTMARVELRQELNQIKMKKNGNPAGLFEQISAGENIYNNTAATKIDEEDLIAVILDAVPAEYQAVLTSKQRSKGDTLKQGNLEDAMNQHWRQLNKNKTAKDEDEDAELTLSAITCYECNEEGHKANQCPNKKKGAGWGGRGGGGGRGFSGNCNNCGKTGHISVDCWEKAENAEH